MAFLEVNFVSEVLGVGSSMYVILPQKTNGNIGITQGEIEEKYPTLYLLHGLSDDHTTWMRRTSIERYAEEYGIAVVMPNTFRDWYTDMYYGPKFRTYVGEELPKLCRNFFPGMSEKRENTYIAGQSMGGYGALALALTYPETFSVAAPLSAAFDPKILHHPEDPSNTDFLDVFGPIEEFDGSVNDLYHLAKARKEDGSILPSLYISCGTEDALIGHNRKMRSHLLNLGYDVTYHEVPGEHNWVLWDQEIQQVLAYIASCRGKEN